MVRTSRSPVNYASKEERRVVEPCLGPVPPARWAQAVGRSLPCPVHRQTGTCTGRGPACWTGIVSSDAIPPTTSMSTVRIASTGTTGGGYFRDVGAATGVADPGPSQSAAWGDYDGDGYLDL